MNRLVLLLTTIAFSVGQPSPGYIVHQVTYNGHSCSDPYTDVYVTSTSCSTFNGFPYGYATYNSSFIVQHSCVDSTCQNCSSSTVTPLGCQVVSGTSPRVDNYYTSLFVPALPEGASVSYYYQNTNCTGELQLVYAQTPTCKFSSPSSLGNLVACNSTAVYNYAFCSGSTCNPTACSVTIFSTDTCQPSGNQGLRFHCNNVCNGRVQNDSFGVAVCVDSPQPPPSEGYIISTFYPENLGCVGDFSMQVISTGCNNLNGYPYGYLTYNKTWVTKYDCEDSMCLANCSISGYEPINNCSSVPGTFPYSSSITTSLTIPSLPTDYSLLYSYSKPGCNDSDLVEITAQGSSCRLVPHSSFSNSIVCNSTHVTASSNCVSPQCDAPSCSSVLVTPVGECIAATDSSSFKYVCNVPAPPSNNRVTCSAQYECSGVSDDYNYVRCNNGYCQCSTGFQGSATTGNKCTCNGTVAYDTTGTARCLAAGECINGMQWLCTPYSDNYNYVNCANGKCVCNQGFDGNATLENRCHCSKNLSYTNGIAMCQ